MYLLMIDIHLRACSFFLCSYQFAVILLSYLFPLLVMLVTYSLVGQSLWGGRIPGEATDHYHSQITAKRKVTLPVHCHTQLSTFDMLSECSNSL